MNCPSKTDPIVSDGHNQNPNDLSADLTTRSDLGRIANARLRKSTHQLTDPEVINLGAIPQPPLDGTDNSRRADDGRMGTSKEQKYETRAAEAMGQLEVPSERPSKTSWRSPGTKTFRVLRKYSRFMGPGFMISVVSSPGPVRTLQC